MTVYHLLRPGQGAADDHRLRGRSLPEPRLHRGRSSGPRRAPSSASTPRARRNPELKLDEKMLETAFTKHTYRHTIIGYLDDVKAMPSGLQLLARVLPPLLHARQRHRRRGRRLRQDGDAGADRRRRTAPWKGKLDAVRDPGRAAADGAPRGRSVDVGRRRRCRVSGSPGTRPRRATSSAAAVQNRPQRISLRPHQPALPGPGARAADRRLDGPARTATTATRISSACSLRVKDAEGPARRCESAVLARDRQLAGGKVDAKRLDAVRSNLKYGAHHEPRQRRRASRSRWPEHRASPATSTT